MSEKTLIMLEAAQKWIDARTGRNWFRLSRHRDVDRPDRHVWTVWAACEGLPEAKFTVHNESLEVALAGCLQKILDYEKEKASAQQ